MKRKSVLIAAVTVVAIVAAIFAIRSVLIEDGKTAASRERILEDKQQVNWHIANERNIEDCVVSAAYNDNREIGIFVFKPDEDGRMSDVQGVWMDDSEIAMHTLHLEENSYDIAWFSGAETSHAIFRYKEHGRQASDIRFDTSDMNLIYSESPSDDYELEVTYYGKDGTKYQ